MDQNMKRNLILEHYQNPTNKGLVSDDSYITINTNNASCIDNINLMIKLEDNKIKDIRFDGEACVICISSTSIMINSLIGKTIDEALEIIDNFNGMINETAYNQDLLKEALVYDELYKQPNRKKCALLTWDGLKKVLEKNKK